MLCKGGIIILIVSLTLKGSNKFYCVGLRLSKKVATYKIFKNIIRNL